MRFGGLLYRCSVSLHGHSACAATEGACYVNQRCAVLFRKKLLLVRLLVQQVDTSIAMLCVLRLEKNYMTASYNEFMREYKMTGSEKADGYSHSVFVGLEPNERAEVFEILLTELPYSTKWLFFLDAERAMPLVKEEERALRGDRYKRVFMLQENLVEYTGDLEFQAHMIEDYPHYVDYLKPLVIDAIGRTPLNSASIEFLRKAIATEMDGDVLARAVRWLPKQP